MGGPYPMELRTPVVAFVEEGHSYREAAERFRVSAGFVTDIVSPSARPVRSRPAPPTGAAPAGTPGRGHGRLAGAREWIRDRMAGKPDATLDEPTAALPEERSIKVHRSPGGRLLHGLGPSHGKRHRGKRAGA